MNKILKRALACMSIIISLSLIFPAGMVNTNVQIEICAEFFTNLTKNHTNKKTYSTMFVEAKDGSTKQLAPTIDEFNDLYGSFRSDRVCFASTANINKESNIVFPGAGVENLSMLYTTTGINIYNVEKGYVHERYSIYMMFGADKSDRPISKDGFCFISKSHATNLLKSGFLEEPINEPYSEADYQKLQYKYVDVMCNGDVASYCIISVFLEEGYFVDALNDVMGDFIFVCGAIPGGLKRQSTYFMRDSSFANEYYIKYAKDRYDISDFKYNVGRFNVIDNFADTENIGNLIFNQNSNALSIILICLSLLFYALSLALVFIVGLGDNWIDFAVLGISLVFPYTVFKLVSLFTDSIKMFTGFSTVFNMVMIIVFICLFAVYFIIKNAKIKGSRHEESNF